MRIINRFLLLLMFSACLSACKKDLIEPPETSGREATQFIDVVYGNAAEQKYDIHLPKGRNVQTKVMVFLHGGSWRDEDKSQYTEILKYFVDQGIAVVNMNYRLAKASDDKFPVQMDDIRMAIDHVLVNSDQFVVSDNIALVGSSAGGHLALLYAYAYDEFKNVKAVAALSAPTDFVQAAGSGNNQAIATIQYFLGVSYSNDPDLWRNTSPYWKATSQSAPTMLFVGAKDVIVLPIQSISLQQRLNSFGIKNELVSYPNEGHVWGGASLDDTRKKIVEWMNENMD
ncbi:alpha/beta hydrolase [Solitalea lacus]|uniref:alpha/beta hydrolase n=1 Tax=Solitalea lacus TaxID=2911172 RepID=UPI001EDB07D9|nr:alpha/beta hydrolase [Solitalea lacus]UKJ07601.1 alpha/beta hydrolase [Solitalea lacus]